MKKKFKSLRITNRQIFLLKKNAVKKGLINFCLKNTNKTKSCFYFKKKLL